MVAVRRSVLCALVLALLTLAAVRATTPKARSAVQRLAPDDLGTTWTYRDTTDGQPTGQSVYQVTGHAILGSGDIASVLHEHFDDFLGSGELVDASDYRGFVGGTVVDFGLRSAPGYTAYSPPIPTVPRTLGKFTYDGKQTGPTGTVHVDGDVLGVETVAVAGRTFTGCEHIRTNSTTKEGSQPASTQVTDAWDCPDVGTVKDVLVLSGKSLGGIWWPAPVRGRSSVSHSPAARRPRPLRPGAWISARSRGVTPCAARLTSRPRPRAGWS